MDHILDKQSFTPVCTHALLPRRPQTHSHYIFLQWRIIWRYHVCTMISPSWIPTLDSSCETTAWTHSNIQTSGKKRLKIRWIWNKNIFAKVCGRLKILSFFFLKRVEGRYFGGESTIETSDRERTIYTISRPEWCFVVFIFRVLHYHLCKISVKHITKAKLSRHGVPAVQIGSF